MSGLSGTRRGGIDDADRVCASGRDSVGDGIGRSRGVLCGRHRAPRRSATTALPATRDIVVQYFDVNTGTAKFRLRVGSRVVGEWTAADRFPTRKLDGSSSTRYVVTAVPLRSWRSHRDRRDTRRRGNSGARLRGDSRSRDRSGPLRCATRRERARRTPPECRCAARGRHCRRRVCGSVPRVSSPAATR